MTRKIHFIAPFAVAIIGLIIGSFLDLQIANGIFFKDNIPGLIFSAFGCAPIWMFFSMISAMMVRVALKKEHTIIFRLFTLGIAICGLAVGIYFQYDQIITPNAFNYPDFWYLGLIASLLINAGGFVLGLFFYDTDCDKTLVKNVLITVGICSFAIIMTQAIKSIMLRPRFRLLVELNDMSLFTNWFQPGKAIEGVIEEELKSFPSGHATMSAGIMVILAYLPSITNKVKINQTLLFYIGFAYTLLVIFTRLSLGAHFLSDVSFGLLITTVVFYGVDFVFYMPKKQLN